MSHTILAINIGSTSTKLGLHKKDGSIVNDTISYPTQSARIQDDLDLRKKDILKFIEKESEKPDLIVSRGGVGKPAPAGIYKINKAMCEDLLSGKYGLHISALGPSIALDLGKKFGIDAVIIDPPSTDEFQDLSRISGIPALPRTSGFHCLNHKAAARMACRDMKKKYENVNLIVAHMGGGITIGAHEKGRVIDATHGLNDGPFTPERSGSLPIIDLINLVLLKGYTKDKVREMLVVKAGLFSYLGTKDATIIEDRIRKGDEQAGLVYEAMAYQIAKDIAAMAAVLKGKVDAIVLTGGLAHSKMLVSWIKDRVEFIAKVLVYPGEDEISALIQGGLRVLKHEEKAISY
jgi:butyrate kinase